MALRAVRWRGFRGFLDSGWREIRPLSVVIGPNNSGKSSFLKPLLLLKQTLASDDTTAALVTRGDLAHVGSYEDLVFMHQNSTRLGFAMRFRDPEGGKPPELGEGPPTEVQMSFSPDPSGHGQIRLHQYRVLDAWGRTLLKRTLRKNGDYSLLLMGRQARFTETDVSKERAAFLSRVEAATKDAMPSKFFFNVAPVLAAAFPTSDSPVGELPHDALMYIAIANYAAQSLRGSLQSISYVGPLREPFRRLYELSGDIPSDVGVAGAKTPEIIIARHLEPEFDRWLQRWIRRFGFSGGLQVETAEDLGVHRVVVRSTPKGPPVNIADSGFGLSQVLPFIVHGFHSEKESVLIAEQPEIHLNPRLQLVLADLFAAIVRSGRLAIIETHSEHLLTRLRVLIAQRRLSASQLGVIYVEKAGSKSRARYVPVSDNGDLPEDSWPKGFFAESMTSAIELLKARRN